MIGLFCIFAFVLAMVGESFRKDNGPLFYAYMTTAALWLHNASLV